MPIDDRVIISEETRRILRYVPFMMEDLCVYKDSPLRLEPWQRRIVIGEDPWLLLNKCRQGGGSLSTAVRILGRSQLLPPKSYTGVFVSYNQHEASEKIRYIKELWDGLPSDKRESLVIDQKTEVEFTNGNRAISFPCRAVRGPQNVDFIGDEIAHWKNAETVAEGSRAATIRGGFGGVFLSSPFGLNYFKIAVNQCGKEGTPFRNFKLMYIPWWKSEFLCKDVENAKTFAPVMTTEQRVREFGRTVLIDEFGSYPLEIFQQEFEGFFFDSISSVLSEELILSQSNGELDTEILNIDCENDIVNIDELLRIAVDSLRYKGIRSAWLGYDVGRQRHASEIQIIGQHDTNSIATRFFLTLHKPKYSRMQSTVQYLMENLPVKKMTIDAQGIGNQLAEWAEDTFGASRVIRATFAENQKAEMVATLQKFFESKLLWIYPIRRLHNQLLSVKKITTHSGKQLYDSETGREEGGFIHHADMFWALAMAVYAYADSIQKIVKYTTRSPMLSGLGRRGIALPLGRTSFRR